MRGWAIAFVFLLAGCSRPSTFVPAPRSLSSADSVVQDAIAWTGKDPANRYWSHVLPTGSMKPFIDEHSIVLMAKYHGETIPNGSVVIYRRDADAPHVIHVVEDQNADSVYLGGYANHESDGWYSKTSIEGIMVGQIYTP